MATTKDSSDIRWHGDARTDSKPIIRFGFWSVCVIMVVFLLWAMLFPLASAVITPGSFVSQGKNKLVQHQSGGRIAQIFVRDGDFVLEGQPVIALDTTSAQADLTKLEARYAMLNALKLRLDAERSGGLRSAPLTADGVPAGTSPLTTSALGDGNLGGLRLRSSDGDLVELAATAPAPLEVAPADNAMLQSQRDAYFSGRALLKNRLEALERKAEALTDRRVGLDARVRSQSALQAMTQDELRRLKPLARDGYIARSRLDGKARALLELEGVITDLESEQAALDTQLEEIAIEMNKLRLENVDSASQEYSKIIGELAELSDSRLAAQSAVAGSLVRAPNAGHVIKLAVTTVGGVVGAGDVIGEIVPKGSPLIVEARVQPGDIDYVKIGQEADIVVTAFNRRIDDSLTGSVIYKAADSQRDEKTGDPFFSVRLAISPGQIDRAGSEKRMMDIQAGMQGEIYIHTGSRTFMTYLVKPMIDSFRRAFRET
ncbi:HlyD family type I secretion periplasmic adaptor subunit [Ahrensia sp. R2A130]|uniref:HlyD family type I secretion periplasmic adaptor subunit n=1 Tax=Ahrensia sp. R2A130 TaxID=744979 RepID=UPI0001E0C349|nr:HlyD family type I secretion periplasmic adaptor subunit [Ahrensia sp. R2A130]EFL89422.1 type I secretion membrane fusion protein, HlyD family [Ahrensia sp. R2A130]